MKNEISLHIVDCWNCALCHIGQHKVEFIPDIVGLILQMTLIPENGNNIVISFM